MGRHNNYASLFYTLHPMGIPIADRTIPWLPDAQQSISLMLFRSR